MSAQPSTPRHLHRTYLSALIRWFALIGVAFVFVALGMEWLARSVPIASPFETASATDLAGNSSPNGQDNGFPRPDFRLSNLEGGMLGPPDFPNQIVLLEVWASWCGPCRLQSKFVDELHEEFANQGVQFLAVNLGEDESTVRKYTSKSPFPFPVLLDPQESVGQLYRIMGLPTVMIVDRQGEISFLRTGVSTAAQLRDQLLKAGAGASEA